jgi:hypothetical protein
MKTCIEITDALLEEARHIAVREGTTVRALVEEGLRRALDEHERAGVFKLRRVSFRGQGLRPELSDSPWAAIRDLANRGRGA